MRLLIACVLVLLTLPVHAETLAEENARLRSQVAETEVILQHLRQECTPENEPHDYLPEQVSPLWFGCYGYFLNSHADYFSKKPH